MCDCNKVSEIGTTQNITTRIFERWLADNKLNTGLFLVPRKLIYNLFLEYIRMNKYTVKPSNINIGKAARCFLDKVHKRDGNWYFVDRKMGGV